MALKAGHIGAATGAQACFEAYVRSPHVDRVVFCAPASDEATALRRRYGIIKQVAEEVSALLADPDVAVVSLAVPLAAQPALAEQALRAGKPVLCRGPLAPTLAEADALLATAEETGQRLLATLYEPWLPAHVKARALLEAGEVGPLVLATILTLAATPPEEELVELVQPVALLEDFCGPARAVTALRCGETLLAGLEFGAALAAQLTLCHAAAGDHPATERRLVTATGSLLIRDNPEDEWPLIFLSADDFHPLKVKNPPHIRDWAQRECWLELLDCVVTDKSERVSAAAQRSALATSLALLEAARGGRRVALTEDE